jgi:hypothetical protein
MPDDLDFASSCPKLPGRKKSPADMDQKMKYETHPHCLRQSVRKLDEFFGEACFDLSILQE